MSPAAPPSFEEIKAELAEIDKLLRRAIEEDPHAVDVWRVRVAADGTAPLLTRLDRDDLSAAEKYWQVAGGLRGVFHGWADSPPGFKIPVEAHRRMHALYLRTLPFSSHPE